MTLVSQNGNGEAEISDLSLVTDEKGALTFSLHIPDPKIQTYSNKDLESMREYILQMILFQKDLL